MGRGHRLPRLGHPRDVPARAGACEAGASMPENIGQLRRARAYRRQHGGPLEAALSAVQVSDRVGLSPAQVTQRLEAIAPKTVRGRTRTPAFLRRHASLTVDGPVCEKWTLGYLSAHRCLSSATADRGANEFAVPRTLCPSTAGAPTRPASAPASATVVHAIFQSVLLMRTGQPERASEFLEIHVLPVSERYSPKDQAEVRVSLASAYTAQGRHTEALRQLIHCRKLCKDSNPLLESAVLLLLGDAYHSCFALSRSRL